MSIVALKRKTHAKYHNMSVGSPDGFSLNGTHRNQGYVGQTSLSRFLSRTTMKGTTAKGHGGCCGQYYEAPVVQTAVTSLENSSVVKPSVVSTKGMIDNKYRWVRRGQPFVSVKPDVNRNLNTQHQYVENLKKKTIQSSCSVVSSTEKVIPVGCDTIDTTSKPRVSRISRYCKLYVKPKQSVVDETGLPYSVEQKDYETYITELHKKCADLDVFQLTTQMARYPINVCRD